MFAHFGAIVGSASKDSVMVDSAGFVLVVCAGGKLEVKSGKGCHESADSSRICRPPSILWQLVSVLAGLPFPAMPPKYDRALEAMCAAENVPTPFRTSSLVDTYTTPINDTLPQ